MVTLDSSHMRARDWVAEHEMRYEALTVALKQAIADGNAGAVSPINSQLQKTVDVLRGLTETPVAVSKPGQGATVTPIAKKFNVGRK